jgi:hypothetical protein
LDTTLVLSLTDLGPDLSSHDYAYGQEEVDDDLTSGSKQKKERLATEQCGVVSLNEAVYYQIERAYGHDREASKE